MIVYDAGISYLKRLVPEQLSSTQFLSSYWTFPPTENFLRTPCISLCSACLLFFLEM
jgi:hypothetical protein